MEDVETKAGSKWKAVVVIAFTVFAVSGMMYMLFTDEKYNRYGAIPSDSSEVSETETKASDSSSYTASQTPSSSTPAASSVTSSTNDQPSSAGGYVTETAPVKPHPKPVAVVKPEPVKVEPKAVAATVVKPQPPLVKPVEKAPVTSSAVTAKTTKPAAPTPKPVAKDDKVMSDDELKQLASDLLAKGSTNGGYAKCVQLHNTADGNNKSTLRQIESYLRSQKFTIAGRQTVSSKVKGLQITTIEGCTRLTVGSF